MRRKEKDEQLLRGNLMARVARAGIEHVERFLPAERLCVSQTMRGRVHAVALTEVKVRLIYARRRRV